MVAHALPEKKYSCTPEIWGKLSERYVAHRPHRMLALDGGGLRGVITLRMLLRIEQALKEKGYSRLCDFFDYIGGTSTGAIIAAGLAIGLSVEYLIDFYQRCGREIFDAACIMERWKYLYKKEPLEKLLKEVFGDRKLVPADLECLLMVVVKNITTDSAWPISSNPSGKYNCSTRPDCNLQIPLWQLVRASTAAPVFFPPEIIEWDAKDPSKSFLFADGGITQYNNPSFQLYKMATLPEYKLEWTTGESQLLLVSIGTGAFPNTVIFEAEKPEMPVWETLPNVRQSLMNSASIEQDINCRVVGRCSFGVPLDRELHDLIPQNEKGEPVSLQEDLGRSFLYVRYNADLSEKALAELSITDTRAKNVRAIDKADAYDDLVKVGECAANDVSLTHFGSFV